MKNWLLSAPYRIPLCLSAWVLLFYGFALGSLEFLRHTEADRTLISWEMLEHGRLLVPTLLNSEILTKPPLYYWCSAFWLWLLGTDSVGVARLTSLFAALGGVLFQYYAWFVISRNRALSGIAAFALSTTIIFFSLGTVAEIDMLFGVLTMGAITSLFFLIEGKGKENRIFILLLGFFTAGAFLTKGPPVVFFLIGTAGTYFFWILLTRSRTMFFSTLVSFSGRLFLSMLIALILVLLWLVPLGLEVGWEVLGDRLEEEVFLRVLNFSGRGRGVLFYVVALFVNGLPWTFFLLIGLLRFFFVKAQEGEIWTDRVSPVLEKNPLVKHFFQFSVCVILSGFIMLSIAQGKSSRYSFPLTPFLLNISILFSFQCLKPQVFRKIVSGSKVLSLLLLAGSLFTLIFITLEGVSVISFYSAVSLLSFLGLLIFFSKPRYIWKHWLVYMIILLLIVRGAYTLMYIPHRNATRGVTLLAEDIVRELGDSPIYTVEMFERWTVYYAKRIGTPAYRLTPARIESIPDSEDQIPVLLALEEEIWRYEQLTFYDQNTSLKRVFPHTTSAAYLVYTSRDALSRLGVSSTFPTYPSIPFYPELAERNLIGK
jgi:hypothetical protein